MTNMPTATSIRREFSAFIDSTVRDKPQFFKRNRDTILTLSEDQLHQLLANFRFPATLDRDEDGSFLAVADGFDMIGVGDSQDAAIRHLAEELMDYAQEYYDDFHLYANATNRSHHFPYVLHVLAQDSIEGVVSLIDV